MQFLLLAGGWNWAYAKGDSTQEGSLTVVNYPFNSSSGGAPKCLPLWPSSFVSACWPPEEKQAGNGQAEFKQGNSSHCSEEECGTLSAEGQAGWGKKNRNGFVPAFLRRAKEGAQSTVGGKQGFQGEAGMTDKLLFLLCQAFIYCTHLQLCWVSLSFLLKPEFKTCGQYYINPQAVYNYQINFRKCNLANR